MLGEPGRVMAPVSRGFRGRRSEDVDAGRVPPGNYLTPDFPVLSAGPTPHDAIERWSFESAARSTSPDRGQGKEPISMDPLPYRGDWIRTSDRPAPSPAMYLPLPFRVPPWRAAATFAGIPATANGPNP